MKKRGPLENLKLGFLFLAKFKVGFALLMEDHNGQVKHTVQKSAA